MEKGQVGLGLGIGLVFYYLYFLIRLGDVVGGLGPIAIIKL